MSYVNKIVKLASRFESKLEMRKVAGKFNLYNDLGSEKIMHAVYNFLETIPGGNKPNGSHRERSLQLIKSMQEAARKNIFEKYKINAMPDSKSKQDLLSAINKALQDHYLFLLQILDTELAEKSLKVENDEISKEIESKKTNKSFTEYENYLKKYRDSLFQAYPFCDKNARGLSNTDINHHLNISYNNQYGYPGYQASSRFPISGDLKNVRMMEEDTWHDPETQEFLNKMNQ
jgi:hypothetical protein